MNLVLIGMIQIVIGMIFNVISIFLHQRSNFLVAVAVAAIFIVTGLFEMLMGVLFG
ncbi:MAG: hypothetical protein M0R80_03690 [Proteobacteria bacterium]|jgi:hexokinase|nr:hypothetical protein [Pseudomonadota bacterium]